MEPQHVLNSLHHQASSLHFSIRRCLIGGLVFVLLTADADDSGTRTVASAGGAGVGCRTRRPRHSTSQECFVPYSAHENLGTKIRSDRERPLHYPNTRRFQWHPPFHYLCHIISSVVVTNFKNGKVEREEKQFSGHAKAESERGVADDRDRNSAGSG